MIDCDTTLRILNTCVSLSISIYNICWFLTFCVIINQYMVTLLLTFTDLRSSELLEDLSNHAVLQRYSHMSSQTRSAISAMDPNVVNYAAWLPVRKSMIKVQVGNWILQKRCWNYCRASHTGDTTRVMLVV